MNSITPSWEAFKSRMLANGSTARELVLMKRAFYAGASEILFANLNMLNEGASRQGIGDKTEKLLEEVRQFSLSIVSGKE
ncbi:MAG: hypothetical protein KDG50_10195 [Chromatiales bacterium]|nr:hypothetical protein [Chromatiales bacterium]